MTDKAPAEGARAFPPSHEASADRHSLGDGGQASAVTITPAVDEAIRAHGQQTYPHECCGALLGRDGRVTELVALPNTTEEGPRRRFLVRPGDYRQAEQRATALGVELLGFYHSHPDHPARPSQYDLDQAWPTFAYIIVAVAQGAATEMTVWFLKDDRSSFEEGTLHHGENPHPDAAPAVHR
jgi:proteasome lid subunit RPN8/RPN11